MNLLSKLLINCSNSTVLAVLFAASSVIPWGAGSKAIAQSVGQEAELNTLTRVEVEEGWILLFDGETSRGWRGYGRNTFPIGWEVEDGTLHMKGSRSADGGDIIYQQEFQNFRLKLDWKISEGGNSGIFYLGQELPERGPIYLTAPEMQVLDNDRHPDARLGRNNNRQAGSLYDLIPAVPQNTRPVGEWNEVEIVVNDGTITHKQNGETVVEYQLGTSEWKELVAGSKFPGLNENWVDVAMKGYIGMQDHGDEVWFRNLKLLEL